MIEDTFVENLLFIELVDLFYCEYLMTKVFLKKYFMLFIF